MRFRPAGRAADRLRPAAGREPGRRLGRRPRAAQGAARNARPTGGPWAKTLAAPPPKPSGGVSSPATPGRTNTTRWPSCRRFQPASMNPPGGHAMNDVTIIDQFLDTFSRYIDSGFGLLHGEVAFLTATLIVIDMTIAGLYWAMSHATGQGEDVIAKLLRKVLYVGAFAYIIGNFNWLAGIVFRSFAGLGLMAGGSTLSMEHFLQPGRLAKTGLDAAGPIFLQLDDMMGFPEVFANLDAILVLFLAWLVVILCFFVLAVQLFITLIEFKLTTLAGFVLVPFALWNKTSFLAEKVLGNVVSSGIKVLVLAVIVGIGSGLFSQFQVHPDEPSIDHALVVMLASLALLALGIYGPGIATGLVRCAPTGRGRDGRCCGRRSRHRRCHRCRRDRRRRCRRRRGAHGTRRREAGRRWRACSHIGGGQRQVGIPGRLRRSGRRGQGRSRWPRQRRQDRRAGGRSPCRIGCCRCRAEGGRFLPCRMERCRGRRFRLRAGQHRRSRRQRRQLAEAGTTRLGQADAPPPADHPCRNHRRPHAARWRRRRLRARSEPARFRYLTPRRTLCDSSDRRCATPIRRSLPPRIKPPPKCGTSVSARPACRRRTGDSWPSAACCWPC